MANDIFRDFLHIFLIIYLDDLFIYSRTQEEPDIHVHKCCLGPRGVTPWTITDRRVVVSEWTYRHTTLIACTRYVTKLSVHVILATTHVLIRHTRTRDYSKTDNILLPKSCIYNAGTLPYIGQRDRYSYTTMAYRRGVLVITVPYFLRNY